MTFFGGVFMIFSIIGGDERMVYLRDMLKSAGHTVRMCGFEKHAGHIPCVSLGDAVFSANCIVLPVPTSKDGKTVFAPLCESDILLKDIVSAADRKTVFFTAGTRIGAPVGKAMDSRELRAVMEELITQGAENIDLVTPTHYLPTIVPALSPRLSVPVVYNCGGYERVETLRQLEGLVDVYLPDLKYADNALAASLSGAPDYFEVATAAIREMVRQTGYPHWEGEKLVRGTVIRHLILPGQVENSLRVLDWIGENFAPGQVLVSLMRQYTPMGGLPAPYDRTVTEDEYQAVLSWMYLNDLEGFVQEDSAASQAYIPDF